LKYNRLEKLKNPGGEGGILASGVFVTLVFSMNYDLSL